MSEEFCTEALQENEQPQQTSSVNAEEIIATKKSPVKIIISAIAVTAVIAAFVILTVIFFIPNSKYNKALALDKAGSYDEAIAILTELDDYKDSAQLIDEVIEHKEAVLLKQRITDAQKLYDSGDKIGAYKMLKSDKDKEDVKKILDKYAKTIVEESSSKIYWEEDEMSDYRWAHAKNKKWEILSPTFEIYLSQNKNNPADIQYFMFLSFDITGGIEMLPIHPQTFRLKGESGSVDLTANPYLNNYEFENKVIGYTLFVTVHENSTASLTIDQVNTISDIIKNSETVTLRINGASKHCDLPVEFLDYRSAISDMAEFINIMHLIYSNDK